VAVRGIGKREARRRLGMGEEKPTLATATAKTAATKPQKPKTQKRGTFKQTGEEMILGLLKGRKAALGSKINAAWMKEGRKGTAAVLLSRMAKAKKLKMVKVKGQRGSQYQMG